MLNTVFPPKAQAPTKAGPTTVVKVQAAVRRTIKTLRRDISDYAVDLRATYGKGHQR
ncbi:MAG: hypothetical protein ABIZ57_07670 [Candidatus Limnocylindria bacterium]